MRFSTALTLALTGRVIGAPVAEPQEESQPKTGIQERGLLNDLSPDVAGLLISLGLGGLALPVGGIVNTLGNDVKKRGLLNDLSPDVARLLISLGLGGLALPVDGIVDTLGNDVKRRGFVDTVDNDVEKRQLLRNLSPSVVALLASLGLGGLAPPVGGIVTTVGDDV